MTKREKFYIKYKDCLWFYYWIILIVGVCFLFVFLFGNGQDAGGASIFLCAIFMLLAFPAFALSNITIKFISKFKSR